MVYIYLPAAYYHRNLDVTKEICWRRGFPLSQRSFLFSLLFLGLASHRALVETETTEKKTFQIGILVFQTFPSGAWRVAAADRGYGFGWV